MRSAIYAGWVRHRRHTPAINTFRYRLFMMYLDLSELATVFRGRWLWSASRFNLAQFRRSDHLGPAEQDLQHAVHELVAQETGRQLPGPIRLLTHLRYFGYCFNPVSFYFCFDEHDRRLDTIVAEVHNTPWGECHPYVLTCDGAQAADTTYAFEFRKAFHVSPFMPMDMDYRWRFKLQDDKLIVHMESLREGTPIFDATMLLDRSPITGWGLAKVLLSYPFMTLKVITAIHFQALRLWLKRVPVQTHPAKQKPKEI